MITGEFLECQQCGRVVRELTPTEAQKVAENPYDYVVYCADCRHERSRNGGSA